MRLDKRRCEVGIGAEQIAHYRLDLIAERHQSLECSLGLVHLGRRNHFHGAGDFL